MSRPVLAFDTTLAACSVALLDPASGAILASRFEPMERGHAERLAPMIRDIMTEAGVRFANLARIGVTVGPGTFTGQRIGIAMARGLALALGIPAVGVSTLEAIACTVRHNLTILVIPAEAGTQLSAGTNLSFVHSRESGPGFRRDDDEVKIIVANDARREEIYLWCGGEPRLLTIAEAVEALPAGPALVAGSASDVLIAAAGRSNLTRVRGHDLPNAIAVARLAIGKSPSTSPAPLYLRAPSATPNRS